MPKLIKGVGEKPKRSVKKKALIAGVLAVLFVAGAVIAYNVFKAKPQGSGDASVVDTGTGTQAAADAINQAQSRDDLGDVDGAVAIIDSALAKSSSLTDKTDLLTVKGTMLANADRTDEGVAALRQAISLSPGNPTLYKTLGSVYEIADQKDKAISTYQEGITNLEDGPKKAAQANELNGAIERARNNE